tara:strand:- start:699 stop:1394 length:696 start_codon:yes stop_codon:yes gene_type:complete
MTTFSNKILYTRGQLEYRSITIVGNQTETTFNFKDPLFNVISIEAVQGEITTDNSDEWLDIRCKEIDKKIENGITSFDTSLLLTKSGIPFMKNHTSRYFSKPKDRLDSLNILIKRKLPTTGATTLSSDWIMEIELVTVRIPTHADWRNIPETEQGQETSEFLQDKTEDVVLIKNPVSPEPPKKKNKKKKDKKEKMEIAPASTGSSLEGSLITGSLGLLGIGSALALGVKLK